MDLTPETVIGLVVVFAIAQMAIIYGLCKLGIIKIGNSERCPDHASFCKSFKEVKESFKIVRDEHLLQGQVIEQHEKKFEDGKADFVEFRDDIAEIKINIALIMLKFEITPPTVKSKGKD